MKKFSAIAKEHHLSESETGILKNLLIANQMHTLNPVGIRSREDWMAVIYSKARNAKSRRRIQGALLAVEQAYDKFTQDLLNN